MYGDRSPTFYNESCGKMIGHFAVLELLWSPLQWALKWYFLTFTLNMPGHQMGRHCQSKGQTSTGDRHGFTISKAAVNWHEPLQPTTRRYCTLQHTDVQLSYTCSCNTPLPPVVHTRTTVPFTLHCLTNWDTDLASNITLQVAYKEPGEHYNLRPLGHDSSIFYHQILNRVVSRGVSQRSHLCDYVPVLTLVGMNIRFFIWKFIATQYCSAEFSMELHERSCWSRRWIHLSK